jgi:hypothetical protein
MMTSKERFQAQLDRITRKQVIQAKPVLTGIQKAKQEIEWSAEIEAEYKQFTGASR